MYPDMAKKEGLSSLLSVPMMVREKAVGVINSYTSVPHAFTSEEVRLLQAIAMSAGTPSATALKNAGVTPQNLNKAINGLGSLVSNRFSATLISGTKCSSW